MQSVTRERGRQTLRLTFAALITSLVWLIAMEFLLRVIDLRVLREAAGERSLSYHYDAELGWAPTPDSKSAVTTARTIHAQHNSLGFRDTEFVPNDGQVMLFIGDSFVWGVDAEENERFTNLLRARISGYTIVNAGVSGFGTDQEYLWLQRIWPKIKPAVVVLIFCTDNDRKDNTSNIRYDGYQKPYFVLTKNAGLLLRGQPVPKSRQLYFKGSWLVRHWWLARAAVYAYLEIRYPALNVPDPTERLVAKVRDFLAEHGSKLIVGLQSSDSELIQFLQTERIPFEVFDGAEVYSDRYGSHWTPAGHKLVADRLTTVLSENSIINVGNLPH